MLPLQGAATSPFAVAVAAVVAAAADTNDIRVGSKNLVKTI